MQEIKSITIDFWNTLYDSTGGNERNRARQLAIVTEVDKFALFLPADKINEAIEASWKNFEYYWKEHHLTPSAFETVKFIWEHLKLPYSEDAINNVAKVFSEGILHHSPKPLPFVKEILPKLKEKYKIALISDTGFSPGSIIKELMQRDGILEHFDAFSFSNETGVAKPNPKAYYTVLEPLQTPEHQALHIGDIEHTDIIGAKNIGMKAIRFSGDLTKLTEKNPDKSAADFEVYSWTEIADKLL